MRVTLNTPRRIRAQTFGRCGIYIFLGCTGLWGIVKEVTKDKILQYEKRRLTTFVIGAATYVCAPTVVVITNTTKIVGLYTQRSAMSWKLSKLLFIYLFYL